MEAVLIFRDADCGFVPVVDAGKPVGVLTDRDVALALADYKDSLAATAVGDVMTRDVVAVPSDAGSTPSSRRSPGEGCVASWSSTTRDN